MALTAINDFSTGANFVRCWHLRVGEMHRLVIALALAARRRSARRLAGGARTDARGRARRRRRHDRGAHSTGGRSACATSASTRRSPSSRARAVQCFAQGRRGGEQAAGRRASDVQLVLGRRGARPLRPPAGLRLPRARRAVRQRRARAAGLCKAAAEIPPNVAHAAELRGLAAAARRARPGVMEPLLDFSPYAHAPEHRRDRGRLLRGDRRGPRAPRAAAPARGAPAARSGIASARTGTGRCASSCSCSCCSAPRSS